MFTTFIGDYTMTFKQDREDFNIIRCCGCSRLKHKDECWTCDVCESSSCDTCGEVQHGFSATLCQDCKREGDAWDEAHRDAANYCARESYLSMKGRDR